MRCCSVRRVWSRVLAGIKRIEVGRPTEPDEEKKSSLKSDKSLECYQWIRWWGEENGEKDPKADEYDVVLDPFDVHKVYEEYHKQMTLQQTIDFGVAPAVSDRQFRRLFHEWMEKNRVRVRMKKNITTKCDGSDQI